MSDEEQVPGTEEPEAKSQGGDEREARSTRRMLLSGSVAAAGAAAVGIALDACGGSSHKTSSSVAHLPKQDSGTANGAPSSAGGSTEAITASSPIPPQAATWGPASIPSPDAPSHASSGKPIQINVNGAVHTVDASPDTPLLYVLRDDLALRGPKFGCGLSQCGACAVLQDGKQIRSCVTPISMVTKSKIVTLEGLPATYQPRAGGAKPKLHPLQQAWIDEQVPQCGYCQNGMMIQAADLLSSNPHPSDEQIIQAMDGHLCRCGTYNGIVRAIKRASEVMA